MKQSLVKNILLTGATGFVGQQLLKKLAEQNDYALRIAVRTPKAQLFAPEICIYRSIDLSAQTNWTEVIEGCDLVIHAAARAHIMNEKAKEPLQEFRKVNTEGTLKLAAQAASSGVKRFIFISSIKVNGESTFANKPFSADDLPNPQDPYAISKYEAEQGLQELAAKTGMEVVIIRPPLVYGPGVKGNFQRMLFWLQKGLPIPLGAVTNKRSFVSIENLNSLILTCISNPRAANQVFLVSDGDDLSTTELLSRIGHLVNKPARLLPIPQILLSWAATLVGRKEIFERLCGSLQLDINKTKDMLDWKPQISVNEALEKMLFPQ
ncbi:MAG: SDR family oxidoreductase [Tatlockia sp.]|nr:SDR family oxidoreductase [Tatlockia sp.]